MLGHCSFCGRHQDDCPGGLWHLYFGRARHPGDPAICRYCARSALRCVGAEGEMVPAAPVSIFTRRPVVAVGPDDAA